MCDADKLEYFLCIRINFMHQNIFPLEVYTYHIKCESFSLSPYHTHTHTHTFTHIYIQYRIQRLETQNNKVYMSDHLT